MSVLELKMEHEVEQGEVAWPCGSMAFRALTVEKPCFVFSMTFRNPFRMPFLACVSGCPGGVRDTLVPMAYLASQWTKLVFGTSATHRQQAWAGKKAEDRRTSRGLSSGRNVEDWPSLPGPGIEIPLMGSGALACLML
ncbi:hypothetical protein STEG23_017158 [Scotinomys teguina]